MFESLFYIGTHGECTHVRLEIKNLYLTIEYGHIEDRDNLGDLGFEACESESLPLIDNPELLALYNGAGEFNVIEVGLFLQGRLKMDLCAPSPDLVPTPDL